MRNDGTQPTATEHPGIWKPIRPEIGQVRWCEVLQPVGIASNGVISGWKSTDAGCGRSKFVNRAQGKTSDMNRSESSSRPRWLVTVPGGLVARMAQLALAVGQSG